MKKIFLINTLCFILFTLLFSCKKNNTPATPGPYSSMENVFASQALQPLTVTINATRDTSFYGNSGTRYVFYGNSFISAAGTAITGLVQLRVCEYLQKGDMLFSKMLPISNNEPLLSGGELNVSASQDGQRVYLRPLYTFQANMPQSGAPPTGMRYFSGQPTLDTTQFKVNWIQPVQDSSHSAGFGGVTIVYPDTLNIISDSLKECNADQFMTSPDYQNFTVSISVTGATLASLSTVYGYALYDTYKGVWPLGLFSYSNGLFTVGHVPNIPVHFVVFTIINGNFYGGTLGSVTPITGNNYDVNLTRVDPATFKGQVNAL